jgi:hypothetical protein
MEIGCGYGSLGYQVFPSCDKSMVETYMKMFPLCASLLLHRKPEPLSSLFLPFRVELGHLKLHTVGDVDLSLSLGINFGCAGYESDNNNNADGWYN